MKSLTNVDLLKFSQMQNKKTSSKSVHCTQYKDLIITVIAIIILIILLLQLYRLGWKVDTCALIVTTRTHPVIILIVNVVTMIIIMLRLEPYC